MTHYERLYLILRPAWGKAGGHARLEQRGTRIQMSLFVHGLEGRQQLRTLLFSSPDPSGAVVDLGSFETGSGGQGSLTRAGVCLPGSATLSDCCALTVCMDWPDKRLVLAATLNGNHLFSGWTLQDAVDRYLTVPVQPPPAVAPTVQPTKEPPADEKASVPVSPAPLPKLDDLAPLLWPEALNDLKPYFELLPPCAPFDAPGWRFVRAPLPAGGPGPACYIGIHALDGRVRQAAYALPATGRVPPEGLESYRFETGRHQKSYWVLRTDH